MILADKIIRLRKRNGWSQEEFAVKMNVSRQAVSKWEGAQTVPDLERILLMSTLFGVTTDYLLKDELEEEEFLGSDTDAAVRTMTMEEAHAYLDKRKKDAGRIAFGTFLCIISPICLLLLSAVSEFSPAGVSENLAGGLGLIVLLLLVTAAVAVFVHIGFTNAPYEFLEKEPFETAYGVKGMVKEQQESYRNTHIKLNIIGICLCIISPIILFIGLFSEKDLLLVALLCLMIFVIGIGVVLLILTGVRWESMQRLLKEGDFSPEKLEENRRKSKVSTVYWLLAVAIYLAWSFLTDNWRITWVVWPVAGVLFGAVMAVCGITKKQR